MDAELRASIDRLRGSVDALREAIEAAGGSSPAGRAADDVGEKLVTLARLAREGVISEDEYDERKDELLRSWSR